MLATPVDAKPLSTTSVARIPALDGLRAAAIVLVMLDHYLSFLLAGRTGTLAAGLGQVAAYCATGVDLFFVLSGFLITRILVDSKGSEYYFARFYWRRALRIFPAYYAFLVSVSVFPAFFSGVSRSWFFLYLRNWRGPDPASDGMLGHLWSLAVEEQFYLGWAVIVFLSPKRQLKWLAIAFIAVAPVLRLGLHEIGYSGYLIFRLTPARMDSLFFGALVAIGSGSALAAPMRRAAVLGLLASLIGFAALYISTGPLDIDNPLVQAIWPTLSPLFYVSLLVLALAGNARQSPFTPVLKLRVIQSIARYSYAMYLVHLLVGRLTLALFRRYTSVTITEILFVPAAGLFVYCLAALSWRLLEGPILQWRDRFFTESLSGTIA